MRTVGIIRGRGQLTIPDSIRKIAGWANASSVVSISIENPQEIIVSPHQVLNQIQLETLFTTIKKSRAIKGKGDMSAQAFLSKEREAH